MSDSGGSEARAADCSLRWGGEAEAAAEAVTAVAAAATATDDASALEDEPESGGSLVRVDSLTLAFRAIQAGGCQHSQENSGNSLNSSGSGSGSGSGSHLEDEAVRPSCKRASSLKLPSNRLQPDEACPDPAIKKAVRFADALGLDLALVRHVFDLESPPEIPPQAMRDLVLPPSDDEEEPADRDSEVRSGGRGGEEQQAEGPVQLYLSPSFAQPGSAPNFNSRITAQKVVLERAHFHQQTVASTASAASIVSGQVRGFVRVANIGFEKSVRIRASLDSWRSSFDVAADYVAGGAGGSDQFSFTMSLPDWLRAGDRVSFCVAYTVNGETHWDNNFGDNYAFHCVPVGSGPRHGLDQAWTRYD